ncbi:hypothetical protein GLW00_03310 [Halobacillus litoralis]|uniref:Phr family secreted Rap phosphatase inhibitor n=1 Tax=Halobacillus litoralis TaxID=45668 RepID=A0A845F7N8_9BACI|nr:MULTISPECIES: hypothetical protein [Halobacillus]MEC3884051.1 hypothetical protein [Halobacillus sp. HZG1]MYL69861.1 hypothetical protein [Halobacillus litoralis]
MKKCVIMFGLVFLILGGSASVVAADAGNNNSQNGKGNSEEAQNDHPAPPATNPHGDELPFSN